MMRLIVGLSGLVSAVMVWPSAAISPVWPDRNGLADDRRGTALRACGMASSFRRSRLSQRRMTYQVHIVGGGLAGSEAAWQLAEAGLEVRLSEMRGSGETTPAHQTDGLAELVCSNSFRSDDATSNAVGLLHAEMRLAGSLIMQAADRNQGPAGGALAVDREGFAEAVTHEIGQHPLISVLREEVPGLPPSEWDNAI